MPEMTPAALIAAVMEGREGGLERLAYDTGIPYRNIQRWATMQDPKKGPSFRYTAKLLELAGRLRPEAAAPQPTAPPWPREEDRLAVIEEALADVLDNQARALQVLGVPLAELVRPERLPSRHATGRKKKQSP